MPDSLPIWNLADLYQGSDDPLIGEALADLAHRPSSWHRAGRASWPVPAGQSWPG